MAKFRKKPVVVEAEQYKILTGCDGATPIIIIGMIKRRFRRGWWVKTLEGWYPVKVGDWIITGVKNEKYPCKPDIFEMTYEPVENE